MVNVWFSHMLVSQYGLFVNGHALFLFNFERLWLPGDMMHIKLALVLRIIGVSILQLNAFIIRFLEMDTLFDKYCDRDFYLANIFLHLI